MDVPACEGGSPLFVESEWPAWPVFDQEEQRVASEVIGSGAWWYGDRVAAFERGFAEFQGAEYAVSCTNGTAALRMAIAACGIGRGDEVVVPAYTFVATALAPMLAGATVVCADIDPATANVSVDTIAAVTTERTRAIMPVHFAGLPCDMESILDFAGSRSIAVIEDACHSWGSRYRGRGTGTLGCCGAFSFQMSKNITAGEGGVLVTDDREIAETARSFSNCGRREGAPWYQHFIASDNLRMTEVQAALLSVQLKRLDNQTRRREAAAAILDRGLREIAGIAVPPRSVDVDRRAYHLYLFRFENEHGDRRSWRINRDRFVDALNAEGIPASAGYPIPISKQPVLEAQSSPAAGDRSLPGAERLCREAVWLPHRVLLADDLHIKRIVEAVRRLRRHFGGG